MFGIALNRSDKLRYEVVALFQLHINVGKSILTAVSQSHEVVVDANNPKHEQYNDH